eukprot:TRINITY_DN1417_c0_g1_i3.p1 TRINITY_DN1417_c0_g1~~TRINITY_DN1417_c0_g1_i3.p1  ORF type:complete len:452 (-),score=66.65 TRINITY_DN1417_c0_g1_i3:99-1454(-)
MVWGQSSSTSRLQGILDKLRNVGPVPCPTSLFLLPSYVTLSSKDCISIASALENNTQLTELYMSGHNLGVDGASALARALSHNHTLRTLAIGHAQLGEDIPQMEALAPLFAQNASLTSIDLQNKSLSNNSVEIIAHAIQRNTNIQYLDLSRNKLDDRSVPHMATLISSTHIINIDLSNNTFTHPFIIDMASMLRPPTSQIHLQRLILSHNSIGDDGAVALASWLPSCPSLRELVLDQCNIGPAGARALASPSTSLRHFSMSSNSEVGDSFAESLKGFLQSNRSLSIKNLVLSDTNLSDQGAVELAEAMLSADPQGEDPITIDLSRNAIGAPGAAALARLLRISEGSGRAMKQLNLAGNVLTSAGVLELADALGQSSCALSELNVSGNQVGEEGVRAMFERLTQHPSRSLRVLEVTDNGVDEGRIDPEGMDDTSRSLRRLQDAMPSLDIKWR